MTHPLTVAVIAAGGSGTRMGEGTTPKQLMPLCGEPVIARTLRAFDRCTLIDRIVIVTRAQDKPRIEEILSSLPVTKPCTVRIGGETRTESVSHGVADATDAEYVVIHDAVRCLIRPADIERVIRAAYRDGAATAAAPVTDTVKRLDAEKITGTVERTTLVTVQTPQVFRASLFLPALKAAQLLGKTYTDDCAIMEEAGYAVTPVYVPQNEKITFPRDLKLAQMILSEREENKEMLTPTRIGHGYDVHRLKANRALIIGGVRIPYEKGLDGHSDADVLVHAVMDAMLGAAGLPDIGHLFPDSDDRYLGADSLKLLAAVRERVREAGFVIVNLDATVVAQAPKMAPHIPDMKKNIAAALGCSDNVVNVKATTEEHLGFTGTGEGIAAHAVCLLSLAGHGAD